MLFRALQIIRRAAQASPGEWGTRARQAWYAAQDRLHAAGGRSSYPADGHLDSLGLRHAQDIHDWWNGVPTPPWLDATRIEPLRHAGHSPAGMVGAFSAGGPAAESTAELVVADLRNQRFRFFSRPPIDLSHPRKWHRDPFLLKEAPHKFYGAIPYLDPEVVGDSKHVWEPNRWGWVYPLGAQHLRHQDRHAFGLFRELALDWLEANHHPFGINYCSALELAFRGYAMRWSLELFRQEFQSPTASYLLNRLFHEIWLSCHHVERNLSTYFAPNTHLLGEAFLLFVIGTSLPQFGESERWRRLGKKILDTEAARQFHSDGMHRELSTCYHLYCTDFYQHAGWVGQRMDRPEPGLEEVAFRLARRLEQLTPDSGYLPPMNDCDGGRLTWFATRPLDARPSLLFARQCWPEHFASRDDSVPGYHQWMSATASGRPPSQPVASGDDSSGIVVCKNSLGDFVLFRSGPFGYLDCPHSHDAPLGLLITLGGQPIVVDCGTGAYTQGAARRDRYRLAAGKNTILVHGEGPSRPAGPFGWRRVTHARLVDAVRRGSAWSARGEHTGFTDSCGFSVHVSRAVIVPEDGIVVVVDEWHAERPVPITIPWTINPDLKWNDDQWSYAHGCCHYSIRAVPSAKHAARVSVVDGPYSRDYGWDETTRVLRFDAPPSHRGSCVSLFSRRGPVTLTEKPHAVHIATSHSIHQLRRRRDGGWDVTTAGTTSAASTAAK